ncbi:MAG: long-chain-fatty-acid--CoA ligase [Rhodospirillaceae bacterium]|jgi:long-chain acyl-CoA synthetase|nr:long-chain-fatty-acid--CoA ligase [Rhodospirillaceae bacterium]MBT3491873.1 long-chain-fatty-acid--CoA ligase [Rhodospirillaceae bacterium]MBT3783071.1 long-chain-fatty-acid--CoA ligase [Rhodospirillaceae bacterium]MBT3978067.1 long-chain-fatty-acid--CoA ligase [Rhodospirillaceae bacterium]MBT4166739.1 long-chain-fatty-acid--CoA ligase [Rhodospirillaceae bacterium]
MKISNTISRNMQVNGDGIATIFGDRKHSWNQFGERIARLAAGLTSLGLERGDRVAVLSLNNDRYMESYFGVPWGGHVLVPINTRLAPPEVVFWLNDSGATVLMVDETFVPMLPKIQDQLETVKHVVFLGDGPAPQGMLSFEGLLAGAAAMGAVESNSEDLAILLYTGGTTGRSKGVMLSQNNVLVNALQFAPTVGYRSNSVYLHAAPMFHIADGTCTYAIATAAGTSVIIPGFEPEAALRAVQDHKVSVTLWVPTMVNMAVYFPGVEKFDLSSLIDMMYGASPMPEAVVRRAMEVMPNTRFHHAYGQTESAPILTVLDPARHVPDSPTGKLGSCGQAIMGVQLKIVDEDENEVPTGEVGELCARGDNVMLGYWGQPEMTAHALRNGWLHTGDGARMDEEGFVYIVDRVKDMIISGGENVYSAEVEDAIYQHAAVAECAVIGIPHDKWGEEVHAIIRLHEGQEADEKAIIEHCHTLIAAFKCPRSVELRTDPLPLSGAGKILKAQLREPYWADQDKAVH